MDLTIEDPRTLWRITARNIPEERDRGRWIRTHSKLWIAVPNGIRLSRRSIVSVDVTTSL